MRLHRHRIGVAFLLLAGGACLATVARSADMASGKEIATSGTRDGAPACGSCHGANGDGRSDMGAPRLAGLDAGYLRHQLAAFSNGSRENALMGPIAKALGDEPSMNVAAYYASLQAPVADTRPADEHALAVGQQLALRGDWAAKVPACAACHGLRGFGVNAAFPALAGQGAGYVASQLKAWKDGTRHDDPMKLMGTIAKRLDDGQIAAVAAYYASLAPQATGVAPKEKAAR